MTGTSAGTGRWGEHGGWPAFEAALASVLAILDEDQYLILAVMEHGAFVQFRADGPNGLRIETATNALLQPADRLRADRIARLRALGYRAPTQSLPIGGGMLPWDESCNEHQDFPAPVDTAAVARVAVATLTEVWHVPDPRALVHEAFTYEGDALDLPELGLREGVNNGRRRRRRAS